MSHREPQLHTFSAALDCRYLLRVPESPDSCTLLAVALHGYGQNAGTMLELTSRMLGPSHAVAALSGPHPFFAERQTARVGYSWITSEHPESSIRLHHEMVRHVLDEAGRETGVPPSRCLLIGFSQPVGLNYRFAAAHPDAVRGVIGICGGIPRDWDNGHYGPIRAALLHVARREDEFYPAETTAQYPARLRRNAADVEFHMLEGGHRFPSKAGPIVESWLSRIIRP